MQAAERPLTICASGAGGDGQRQLCFELYCWTGGGQAGSHYDPLFFAGPAEEDVQMVGEM